MNTQQLQARLAALERRLDQIERRMKALDHRTADLESLKQMVGNLKFEVEQMQEA